MKTPILLLLIGQYCANSYGSRIAKRDLATIQGAFVDIQAATSTLEVVVRGISSNPQSAAGLGSAIQRVENALAQARVIVGPTQPIGLADGPALQQTAESLTSTVKITVMSMVIQKPTLDQIGMTATIVQTLQNQKLLAGALGQVVLGKLPAEGLASAQVAFGGAAGSLDVGLAMLGGKAQVVGASTASSTSIAHGGIGVMDGRREGNGTLEFRAGTNSTRQRRSNLRM